MGIFRLVVAFSIFSFVLDILAADYSREGNFQRIEKATERFIATGISGLHKNSYDLNWLRNDLGKAIGINYRPEINEEGIPFYSRLVLSTPTDYYRIINIQQQRTESGLYEYWVVKKHFRKEANGLAETNCQFYLTRSNDFFSQRTIIRSTPYYEESYELGSKNRFTVDQNDKRLLYYLEAWDHVNCFNESKHKSLISHIVFAQENGYVRQELTPLLRLRLKMHELEINLQ
jgi:hypothetical protein